MTSPTPTDQELAVLANYQAATVAIRGRLTAYLTALWRSLGTYRNEQMAAFTAQAVPVVAGAQQQMASLTAAYLGAIQSVKLGTPFTPVGIDPATVTGAAVRNGTDPTIVYERPFHLVWRQLGAGTDPPAAIQAGLDRTIQSGLTDLQLTKTHSAVQAMGTDSKVAGYRRVLEGAHSCGLCVVASTQRYHRATLMPIHPACDCSVAPIYGDTDPGHVIDEAALAGAKDAVAATFGDKQRSNWSAYRDLLITHQHQELGPVLGVRGRPFRGPHDLTLQP